jgi:membrane-bound ClpP family serine protease
MWLLLIPGVAVSFLTLLVIALFLHKKSAGRQPDVIGALGVVETQLNPEGAIIVNGELWRALAQAGTTLAHHSRVRVIGAQAHLLLVEPAHNQS